jgi:hypothetical protein
MESGRRCKYYRTSVETAIGKAGCAGAALPTVRELADALRVSPTTVAAAYRTLRQRGLVQARGRQGTRVSHRPPLPVRPVAPAPSHLRDVSLGNPDPELLPVLKRAFARLPKRSGLYGEPANRPALLAHATRQLAAEGIPHDALAVVGGALDGIERVLQAHLRPGDRVAVEDPGMWPRSTCSPRARASSSLWRSTMPGPFRTTSPALRGGVEAFIPTPRAQNPTGAALDRRTRARELRRVLALAIPTCWWSRTITTGRSPARRRSPSVTSASAGRTCGRCPKSLGPDLRVAILAGDPTAGCARPRTAAGGRNGMGQPSAPDLVIELGPTRRPTRSSVARARSTRCGAPRSCGRSRRRESRRTDDRG